MQATEIVQEGSVCVELFRNSELTFEKAKEEKRKIQLLGDEKALSIGQEDEALRREYQDLGLNGQVQLLNKKVEAVKDETRAEARITPEKVGFQRIAPAEMSIWKNFLPTEYRRREDISRYLFDLIPQTVITEWESARLFGLFQSFSIRTPERESILKRMEERPLDPILVGWFDGDPYLISRWGESLKSFSEIKARVWLRRIFEPAVTSLLIGLDFIVGICLIYFQCLNPSWINLLHCGYWLFFMPILMDEFFLAIWRELYLFRLSKESSNTWKVNLYFDCLALSLLGGLLLCIVNVFRGMHLVLFSSSTLATLLYWLFSLIVVSTITIYIVRKLQKT